MRMSEIEVRQLLLIKISSVFMKQLERAFIMLCVCCGCNQDHMDIVAWHHNFIHSLTHYSRSQPEPYNV